PELAGACGAGARQISGALSVMRRFQAVRLLAFITLGIAAAASAQGWPAKPVRVIAPFTAGGAADTLGRIISTKLTESLGQNFIVENRAGAGGVIGSDLAATAAPGGYTLVVSGVASHVVAPAVTRVPFDALKDFTHIALI